LPSQAVAQTEVTTDRIEARRRGPLGRVVQRIAWSRVADSRDQVRAIVKERTERKIRAEFDRILDERLARVNRTAAWRHSVLWMLGSSGRPRYFCRSSDRGLQIAVALHSGESADEAEFEFPQAAMHGRNAQFWIHETVAGEWVTLGLHWLSIGRRLFGSSEVGPRGFDLTAHRDWLVLGWGKPADDAAASAALAANR
jgi:hypothetical protein